MKMFIPLYASDLRLISKEFHFLLALFKLYISLIVLNMMFMQNLGTYISKS